MSGSSLGSCQLLGVLSWGTVVSAMTGESFHLSMLTAWGCTAACRGVEVGAECSEAAVALIEACLSQVVAARPTAAQLVAALEALQSPCESCDIEPCGRRGHGAGTDDNMAGGGA